MRRLNGVSARRLPSRADPGERTKRVERGAGERVRASGRGRTSVGMGIRDQCPPERPASKLVEILLAERPEDATATATATATTTATTTATSTATDASRSSVARRPR